MCYVCLWVTGFILHVHVIMSRRSSTLYTSMYAHVRTCILDMHMHKCTAATIPYRFPNLGILHVTKKKVPDILTHRLIQQVSREGVNEGEREMLYIQCRSHASLQSLAGSSQAFASAHTSIRKWHVSSLQCTRTCDSTYTPLACRYHTLLCC